MSEQNSNLLLNGDFTERDRHWGVPSPDTAKFENGYCLVQAGAECHQIIHATEGKYRLTLKMKADPHFICKAWVLLAPSFTLISLEPFSGNDWSVQYLDFEAPADNTLITVKLGSDYRQPHFGAYFDDVRLESR